MLLFLKIIIIQLESYFLFTLQKSTNASKFYLLKKKSCFIFLKSWNYILKTQTLGMTENSYLPHDSKYQIMTFVFENISPQ